MFSGINIVFPKCIKSRYWGDDPFRSINPKNRRILSNSEFYYILNAINGQVGIYKVCKMHFTNLKKSGVCDIFILQKGGVSNA